MCLYFLDLWLTVKTEKKALHSTIICKVSHGGPVKAAHYTWERRLVLNIAKAYCLIANICLLSAPERIIKFPLKVIRWTVGRPRNVLKSHQRDGGCKTRMGKNGLYVLTEGYRIETQLGTVLPRAVWWFLSPIDQKIVSILWPSKSLMHPVGMTSLSHTHEGESGLLVAKDIFR